MDQLIALCRSLIADGLSDVEIAKMVLAPSAFGQMVNANDLYLALTAARMLALWNSLPD